MVAESIVLSQPGYKKLFIVHVLPVKKLKIFLLIDFIHLRICNLFLTSTYQNDNNDKIYRSAIPKVLTVFLILQVFVQK